jgi:hypothetical protein
MADRRDTKARGPGPAQTTRFSRKRFESTPEFANFKAGMTQLLSIPKAELDALVKKAKETSPRAGNPKAAGRKRRNSE